MDKDPHAWGAVLYPRIEFILQARFLIVIFQLATMQALILLYSIWG